MTDTLIPHILALDTAQEDCGAAILLADGSLFMPPQRTTAADGAGSHS